MDGEDIIAEVEKTTPEEKKRGKKRKNDEAGRCYFCGDRNSRVMLYCKDELMMSNDYYLCTDSNEKMDCLRMMKHYKKTNEETYYLKYGVPYGDNFEMDMRVAKEGIVYRKEWCCCFCGKRDLNKLCVFLGLKKYVYPNIRDTTFCMNDKCCTKYVKYVNNYFDIVPYKYWMKLKEVSERKDVAPTSSVGKDA